MLVGKCSTCDRYVELGDTDEFCPKCGATGFYTQVQDITPDEYEALLKPKPKVDPPFGDDFDYDAGSELFEELGPGTSLNWLQYQVLVQLAFVGLTGLSTCTGTFREADPPYPFGLMLSVMFVSMIASVAISVTAPRRDSGAWHVTRTLVVVMFTVAQPVTFFVLVFSGLDSTPTSVAWPLAILWLLPWLLIVLGRPWRVLDALSPNRTDRGSMAIRRLLVSVVALALLALAAGSLSSALASAGPLDWRLLLFAVLPAPFAVAVLSLQLASIPPKAGQPGPARRALAAVSLWAVRILTIPLVAGLLLLVPAQLLRGDHIWTRIVFNEVAKGVGVPFLITLLIVGAALIAYVAWTSAGTWKSSFERNPDEVPELAGSILDIFFRDRT